MTTETPQPEERQATPEEMQEEINRLGRTVAILLRKMAIVEESNSELQGKLAIVLLERDAYAQQAGAVPLEVLDGGAEADIQQDIVPEVTD